MESKDIQAIEAIQWTFTYKITEVQHLNYWERPHKLKLYSPEKLWTLYNCTQHMVPNIDGTMGHKIETRKPPRHGTQCFIQYPKKQKPSTILLRKYNNCIWPSVVQLIAKISESSKVLKLPKGPTMSTHQEATESSTSSLIWGLGEFTKVMESPTRPWSSLSCFETTPSIQVSM